MIIEDLYRQTYNVDILIARFNIISVAVDLSCFEEKVGQCGKRYYNVMMLCNHVA